tara:strand:+ start:524 stop:2389 length:1866 start_codon:yes stop_codon:yes gene_type:complete
MCGIIGSFNKKKLDDNKKKKLLDLVHLLKCRGPDNLDYYFDNKNFLGHTRLSIIDLSSNSNQPIHSNCKRFIMSFNGEIYNFKKLASLLKDQNIVNFSDTKILVELISKFGIEFTLLKLQGMFSISVFDKKNNFLYLARDFFGKKPLYYFHNNDQIFFSSTLSPIIKNSEIIKEINPETLSYYFNNGFCPTDKSIFKNVKKLMPNSYLQFNLNSWELLQFEIHKKTKTNKFINKFELNKVETLLINSVEKRLISDVPVSLLLSSGIDSALVSYYISQINKNIDTYTVGFSNSLYDESKDSKRIAKHFGLKNNTIMLDDQKLSKSLSDIANAFDEPFADSSQIPTMLIFNEVSKFSKVCLTGDGGDEIFFGYNRYQWFLIWKLFFKKNILINKFSKNFFKIFLNVFQKAKFGQKILNKKNLTTNKLEKFLDIFFDKENVYEKFLRTSSEKNPISDNFKSFGNLVNVKDLRDHDINNYLVNDILTKVDRSSMFYSVEARSPFLDKEIYDYLENISPDVHVSIFNRKKILKNLINQKLPKNLISKSKKGFAVPLNDVLFSFYNDVISDFHKIKNDDRLNFINFNIIEGVIYKYFNNKDYKLSYQVWSYYVFFKWFKKYQHNISG